MSCWMLIPIKARAQSKRRLASALGPDARIELAREMLANTLECAARSAHVTRILVASPERDQVPACVEVLWDDGSDLNAALCNARQYAFGQGARELVVVHADLPTLDCADIDRLIEAGRRHDLAIAADRAYVGTNALYLRSPQFKFMFGGEGSRARHEAQAHRDGLRIARVATRGLADDLDTADDLLRHRPWLLERRIPAIRLCG